MSILISGGCKNGKSYYAQERARDLAQTKTLPLYYLATMEAVDEEDNKRIKNHQGEREGWGFQTIEQGRSILKALDKIEEEAVVLLDSTTALLANEMFQGRATDERAGERLVEELTLFGKKRRNTIFVTDYIYGNGKAKEKFTNRYMESLAKIDRALAKICEEVIEVSYGNRIYYKGRKGK